MAGSKWAAELGAFINLESTGPAGPDVLFQHTGARGPPPPASPCTARVLASLWSAACVRSWARHEQARPAAQRAALQPRAAHWRSLLPTAWAA